MVITSRKTRTFLIFIFIVGFVIHPPQANAVSLIAGVPNGETTPKGIFMAAHESQVPFSITQNGPRWQAFNFFTYGISDQFEIATTTYNIASPATRRVAASLGYKWVKPLSSGFNFIFGQEFPIALQAREGLGHWTFSGFSYRFQKTKTRLTAGINSGSKQIFGRSVIDAFLGFEQPLSAKWSIIADWFTGRHDLGALISAIQWDPTHSLTVITGPKWANPGGFTQNAWMLEITYEFY